MWHLTHKINGAACQPYLETTESLADLRKMLPHFEMRYCPYQTDLVQTAAELACLSNSKLAMEPFLHVASLALPSPEILVSPAKSAIQAVKTAMVTHALSTVSLEGRALDPAQGSLLHQPRAAATWIYGAAVNHCEAKGAPMERKVHNWTPSAYLQGSHVIPSVSCQDWRCHAAAAQVLARLPNQSFLGTAGVLDDRQPRQKQNWISHRLRLRRRLFFETSSGDGPTRQDHPHCLLLKMWHLPRYFQLLRQSSSQICFGLVRLFGCRIHSEASAGSPQSAAAPCFANGFQDLPACPYAA